MVGTSNGTACESLTDSMTCRCSCGHCSIMPTSVECICCREVSAVVAKIDELGDISVICITQHPGFASVCLNVWVLQAAYFQYRQEHGVPASLFTLQE